MRKNVPQMLLNHTRLLQVNPHTHTNIIKRHPSQRPKENLVGKSYNVYGVIFQNICRKVSLPRKLSHVSWTKG